MSLPDAHGLRRPKTRQQIEAELLAELRRADAEFRAAGPDQREMAAERYRRVLERFNNLILDRKIPPGSDQEP